jgi:hypothetical protein
MAAPAAIVTRWLVIDKEERYLWLDVFRFALSVPFAVGSATNGGDHRDYKIPMKQMGPSKTAH